jgi:hypothetical protein
MIMLKKSYEAALILKSLRAEYFAITSQSVAIRKQHMINT